MLMTAEQTREVMLDSINYYNEPEVYIEKQIAESAYSGKSEYYHFQKPTDLNLPP